MNINFRVGPATATWGRGGGAVAVLLQFPLRLTRQSMVNMGDDRANAPLDPVPVFQHTTFFRETMHSFPGYLPNRSDEAALSSSASRLRPVPNMNGGHGNVLYERSLGPSTFTGDWAFMGHYVLSPGATVGRQMHAGVEEIWYA
jgi:hypothetical protein